MNHDARSGYLGGTQEFIPELRMNHALGSFMSIVRSVSHS